MKMLKQIFIKSFRGLYDLSLDNLSRINLIVGDNNSGKTSLFEAIQFFKNPKDLNNIYKIAMNRDSYMGFSTLPIYVSFINMFSTKNKNSVSIACKLQDDNEEKNIDINLTGKVKKALYTYENLNNYAYSHTFFDDNNEIEQFDGIFSTNINDKKYTINFNLNPFNRISGRILKKNNLINMTYLAPMSHFYGKTFDAIIKNKKYKEICINILKLFDPDIEDLVVLKGYNRYGYTECIANKRTGTMPLSTYGDGIKKVLSLANAIAKSANGVLLIDEIDTSIYYKYLDDIFYFLNQASINYNVQLFISTHSSEAVDSIINLYVKNDSYYYKNEDPINIITLKKDLQNGNTLSRILKGHEVYVAKENFDFEVRI